MISNPFNIKIAPKNIGNVPTIDDKTNVDALSISEQGKRRFEQDTKHRNWLVWWTMGVVSVWLIAVLMIVAFNKKYNLLVDNNVLMTLLATTTLNVLGLARIILGGLFNTNRRFNNKKQKA